MEPTSVWTRFARPILGVAIGAWIVAIGAGMKYVLDHQERAGRAASAPERWPTASRIVRAADRPTLLALMHPRCPCSRASLGELARIQARVTHDVDVVVVMVIPPGRDRAWADTDLGRGAAGLPGARVVLDPAGLEAQHFGAATSGQMLLYGADGTLRFAGGITPGRGHAGDNAGADAVVALVDGREPEASTTAVFGCGLTAPECVR